MQDQDKKKQEAIEANVRKQRQDAAYVFLRSVGKDGSLVEAEKVMGARWGDVLDACEGKKPFQPFTDSKGKVKVEADTATVSGG